ncbi:hypothetical protein KKI93_21975, partial [Xenorhabdus bovienii]|nr:hypothetical protein [Xenorhabdus bovienii]
VFAVIQDMVAFIVTHTLGFIVVYLDKLIFLGMDIDLFTAFRIFKAQFVKSLTFVGAGLEGGSLPGLTGGLWLMPLMGNSDYLPAIIRIHFYN